MASLNWNKPLISRKQVADLIRRLRRALVAFIPKAWQRGQILKMQVLRQAMVGGDELGLLSIQKTTSEGLDGIATTL